MTIGYVCTDCGAKQPADIREPKCRCGDVWKQYCELYGPTPDTLITMCGAGIKSDH